MKKHITLIAAILSISLAACGSTGNADHDYVLSLMEKGDYDMAITVLEHLREQEQGIPVPVETAAAETEKADSTVPDTTQPIASPQVQLVVDAVTRFLAEDGNALMQKYEQIAASPAGSPLVIHAMEYRLGNIMDSGTNAHYLFVCLRMNIGFDGGMDDHVRLLLDMDTQTLLNSAQMDWNLIERCGGMPSNTEEFRAVALNSYHSYVQLDDHFIMRDSEICEVLSEEDIAAINTAVQETR